MKIKKWMPIPVALIVLAITFSAPTEPIGVTEGVVQTIADPMIESIIVGIEQNNYVRYSRFFSPALRLQLPPLSFAPTRTAYTNRYGRLSTPIYLGFLTRANHTRVLYKAASSKLNVEVLITLDIQKITNPQNGTSVFFITGFLME